MSGEKEMRRYFIIYPKYKSAYIRAFARMVIERTKRGMDNNSPSDFSCADAVMETWLHGGSDSDELTLLDDMENEDENG